MTYSYTVDNKNVLSIFDGTEKINELGPYHDKEQAEQSGEIYINHLNLNKLPKE
jgi:hypothetical protein